MKAVWNKYREASLIKKISVALVLGILVGIIFGEGATALAPLGDLLLRLLKFIILPLILFTLIVGINQTKLSNLGRMGGKVFLYYLGTSALAILVGVTIAKLFNPGTGLSLQGDESVEVPENPGVTSVLLNIVPDNIVGAFTEMNLLGIIFTAVVFGIALSYLRSTRDYNDVGEQVYKVVDGLNEATLTVMKGILQYVPIGIFAIIAEIIGTQGLDTILELGNFIVVLYIALLIQLGFYFILLMTTKNDPKRFFSQARNPLVTAFVTQSSSGTLPVTLNAASNLKLNKGLYGFSLPLGATINMDGAAIRIAVSAVFAANVIGQPFGIAETLQVVLIGVLASIGTAGVPGAGIIMIATVFAQVGLPMETVALLTAVDVLVGMGATALNVTGDLVGTTIINKSERKKEA
ncbi:dicarboxylate/amino acid:cation symporter [Halobacillus locisalis]|uniref:Dicarboxylate/amino acid:cation symporter n=1 Tax=Halobacillus locisalis TaxID=220753 RepID=A0A838CSZ9_9BACI|nr:dicarboxylate/amino acid:cation symporter [Halobacillus locisalis]MBA2174949.1 dicarboxylate/amino acid:cation symporter [Halobacillus locisalis]